MKTYRWIFAALLVLGLVVGGCAKKDGGTNVDTSQLQASFKSAEPATQSSADKVVSAVKAQDYSGALAELQTLAQNTKLTPEQQQAIKDVMAQVQAAIANAAGKATSDATKAASDAQKALPK